jgi:AcrR family transcriptional regulator
MVITARGQARTARVSSSVTPTRERLLQAAGAIVEERGYAGATVLAIADRAGVASGTLYRHFASKEELFVGLFREACDREVLAMEGAAAAMPIGAPAVETVVEILGTFARRALRRPLLAWALLAEPVDPLVDAERLVYRARYAELLAVALTAAIAAGEVPPQDEQLTAAALVGACAEVLVGPLSPAASPTVDRDRLLSSLDALIRRTIGGGR